jgi:hypothetical protein
MCSADGTKERLDLSHVVDPFDGLLPLPAEVAFEPLVRVVAEDWHKLRATVKLLANGAVPGITAAQFALVEPDFNARRPEGIANTLRRLRILRGIAQKHSPGLCARPLP